MENDKKQVQELMNTVDEFLIVIDQNGVILRVNQAWVDFCAIHEIRQSLWKLGCNYFEALDALGKQQGLAAIRQVLANEITEYKSAYPFHLSSGGTQWMQMKAKRIQLTADFSYGAVIYHKAAALHDTQEITAEIVLESMTDGFALLNDQFHIVYLNEIAETILNCKRHDVVDTPLERWFPAASGPSFHAAFEAALSGQEVVELVDYYRPMDTWYQVKACPLKKGGLAIYFQDISEKKKTESQLMEYANYDFLTGLPNRRSIVELMESQIAQYMAFSVFHIHIDNLNFINAVHSHNAGETIMIKIAEQLKAFTTDTCHIGRLDGNEFIIAYKPDKGENLELLAEQIEDVFFMPIALDASHKVSVSASIGIACHPYDAKSLKDLLSYAEIAMYEAKNLRGCSYTFFRPKMKALRDRNSVIEKGLREDLQENGFYYALQPQIDSLTGNVVGVEVLSRWTHPEFGELSPLEFIEVAEETDNIVPLMIHLMREVLMQIKDWQQRFGWNVKTAINMTPSLISNTKFFDDVFALLELYEVEPSLIEIEITEQAELTYSPKTLENLLICKNKGMSVAIDDFGTGFSMISYLTNFPINKIKIDRSFVQKIGEDEKSEAILKSLINLATSIECELVAEGVEKSEESAFLCDNGCIVHQGYLYNRPMKVADFETKYLQGVESRLSSSSRSTRSY
ncbi:putative bifunctional diguanylate cyclase/phosphodiesterase [Planococcus dechangensis]|uniref:Bifunctional diguanylate cyclase/phosphodiesterase n=1 Tax=Planococcus dechangensis TaxID=1176255 RepID=A0ABV9MFU7_9BACL